MSGAKYHVIRSSAYRNTFFEKAENHFNNARGVKLLWA